MVLAFIVLFIGWLGFVFAVGNFIRVLCYEFSGKKENLTKSFIRMNLIAFGFTLWYFFCLYRFSRHNYSFIGFSCRN